jgi:plasmid stabilization system protein ParE
LTGIQEVKFSPLARKQFLDALAFIRRDKPSAAIGFRQKADESLSHLPDFPESGRRIPEFPDLAYREVIVSSYRFFYRQVGETVWVVGVWHSRQLPSEPR